MTKALTPADLTCKTTGKRMYVDETAAERGLQHVWLRAGGDWSAGKMPRKVYLCPHCNWWHLSSSTRD